ERFLRDALAHGAKPVSDLEEAAEKAHIDPHTLGQARAELGVVTSRANTGGAQAVQWSLPGWVSRTRAVRGVGSFECARTKSPGGRRACRSWFCSYCSLRTLAL